MLTIDLSNQPTTLIFHPSESNVLAVGHINGAIKVFDLSTPEQASIRWIYGKSKFAVRSLLFVPSQKVSSEWELWCSSSDGLLRIFCAHTGTLLSKYKNLHDGNIIDCMKILEEEDRIIATGDESGCIKIWKNLKCIQEYTCNTNFIYDMRYIPSKKLLFVISGDDSLTVYNIKKDGIYAQTEHQANEYCCFEFACENEWLYAFSTSCAMEAYKWDYWGICSARIPDMGFPVDSVAKLNETNLLLGCSDGVLRLFKVPDAKVVAEIVIDEFPIEKIACSKNIIVCITHESVLYILKENEILNLKKEEKQSVKKEIHNADNTEFYSGLL